MNKIYLLFSGETVMDLQSQLKRAVKEMNQKSSCIFDRNNKQFLISQEKFERDRKARTEEVYLE